MGNKEHIHYAVIYIQHISLYGNKCLLNVSKLKERLQQFLEKIKEDKFKINQYLIINESL